MQIIQSVSALIYVRLELEARKKGSCVFTGLKLIMRHESGTLWARMAGSGKMACMTEELGLSRSGVPAVTRLGEDDWRAWREVRLAALADAPSAFGSTLEEEEALREGDWRAMTRSAAIFVAAAGGILAGVAAGIPRQSARERGLGAMWVAPDWRGSGVAAMLAGAVIDWAREEGCTRVGLWVPADNSRARRFYESQGFQATGQSRPFPGDGGRSISEMVLELG